ncbi:hypothetical protein [Haematobacter sp.]|uniref:hypothetical protein n=1 Tax=Haematobacter sp. TaxID=2953762 RepID=UPI0028B11E68|nr:hypothetical protein [Haematobacter sp.]
MAEEEMTAVLDRARGLLARLQDAKVPVQFMMVTPDVDGEPRILLETPLFSEIGPLKTYDYFVRLADALHDDDLIAEDLVLILPGSPLAEAITRMFGGAVVKDSLFSDTRVGDVMLNGTIVLSRRRFTKRDLSSSVKQMKARIREIEAAA